MTERELIRSWLLWKERTESRDISQKDLAEQAGLSPTYLSSIMTGTRNAGTKTIERIVEALGITLSEFYAGPGGRGTVPDEGADAPVCGEPESLGTAAPVTPERTGDVDGEEAASGTGWRISSLRTDQVDRLFNSFGYSVGENSCVPPLPSPANFVSPQSDMEGIPLLAEAPPGNRDSWPELQGGGFSPTIPRRLIPPRAFSVRVEDDSMSPALERGAVLIIDPEAPAIADGRPTVISRNGRFMVRRVSQAGGRLVLTSSNSSFPPEITDGEGIELFAIALVVPPGILPE